MKELLYRTHIVGGFLAGYLLTGSLSCGAFAAVSALFPDADSPKSFIGGKTPGVSHANKIIFGHRQAFHSLLAAFGFLAIGYVFSVSVHLPFCYVLAGFIGYLSHLVLDTLNPAGVPWLWPLKIRPRIPLLQTGGILERAAVFPVLALLSLFFVGKGLYPTLITLAKGVFGV